MIKTIIIDVDGSLTDGKLYITSHGEFMKVFNVKDGLAVKKLHQHNIIPILLTGRYSEIVNLRAEELGIQLVYQNISNKLVQLKIISETMHIPYDNIAYFGDDENDLECMLLCHKSGCPSDATSKIKNVSDFISTQPGGHGAFREFVDFLLQGDDE